MANAYWIIFNDRKRGCVDATSEDNARTVAATFGTVHSIKRLPYPADPRLTTMAGPYGVTPSFCYDPNGCQGRSSCPKLRSCTE